MGSGADALSIDALGVESDALGVGGSASGAIPRVVPLVHSQGVYERWAKPVLDRIVGIMLSVALLPVVAVVAIVVATSMGRPVIFRQVRVGRFGSEFTVFKFRTMLEDRRVDEVRFGGSDRRLTHKSDDDPRHTGVGRFLRKWSLDEIPQFWNIARGDMSVVGPRPELPAVVARYESWQHRRHEMKPGLTGLWQVSARGDLPMHEATDIDVAYVEDVSLLGDVKILLQTPGAVLGSQKGN